MGDWPGSHSRGSRPGSPHPKPAVGPRCVLSSSEPLHPHLEASVLHHITLTCAEGSHRPEKKAE